MICVAGELELDLDRFEQITVYNQNIFQRIVCS